MAIHPESMKLKAKRHHRRAKGAVDCTKDTLIVYCGPATMKVKNLFLGVPDTPTEELFESLIETDLVRIEPIVSAGHTSAEEFWYDQEKDEWVLVLKGNAGLRFEGCDEVVVLKPGDWINIPAHKKHRVEWTDPNEKTIWPAVHY